VKLDTTTNRMFDQIVYFLIVTLGILQFMLSPRSADYLHDTNYFELANSVIHKAQYGFNGKPMTQLPPGLPYLMAMLNPIMGIGYTAMIHLMTMFAVLALLVTYKLIRKEEDRIVAALACLLIASSPFFFVFSTSLVFADLPYFFLSMVLLLMAVNLDRAKSWGTSQTLQWLIWGPLLVATVLVKSVAIALLVGFSCWLGVSCLMSRETARRRLRIFLPLLILGITAQVSWMVWASQHQYHEWPLPGYQENYVAQLRLKNANQPELGLATWRDVVKRPFASGDDMAAALFGVFTHKEMAPAWYSPGTALPLLIVSIGLLGTFLRTGGGPLEWYFLSYQAMFLFWPWDYERRFFLPVAPLAFLYAWRGGKTLWGMLCKRPTIVGPAGLTLAVLGSLSSLMWGKQTSHPQMWACLAGWLLVAGCSILVFFLGSKRLESVAIWLKRPFTIHGYSMARWLGSLAGVATCVFVIGVGVEVKYGLKNLQADLTADDFDYPEIEAGQWIKLNSAPSSVVIARKDDMIFHYSQRKVIWFPASRDPEILMAGIKRHQVRYVVIHEGNDSYWRPPARECFDALLGKYPNSFRVVHLGPHNTIYEVSPDRKSLAADTASSLGLD
jgi:hypothetical protein